MDINETYFGMPDGPCSPGAPSSSDWAPDYVFLGPKDIPVNEKPVREIHIFPVDQGKIRISCCGLYSLGENLEAAGRNPMPPRKAREHLAELGRHVCGRCAATLFGHSDAK